MKLLSHVRTLGDPMGCSLPGSSLHGIFQARILEWAVISFSSRSSWPRDWTRVSCTAGRLSTNRASRDDHRNRNRVHNKCTSLESSQSLPPPVCQKIVFHKNPQSQRTNFKCTQLSQVAGLGRCWIRGVPRDRTSLAWGPQQTSNSLGDDGRDLLHF